MTGDCNVASGNEKLLTHRMERGRNALEETDNERREDRRKLSKSVVRTIVVAHNGREERERLDLNSDKINGDAGGAVRQGFKSEGVQDERQELIDVLVCERRERGGERMREMLTRRGGCSRACTDEGGMALDERHDDNGAFNEGSKGVDGANKGWSGAEGEQGGGEGAWRER